MTFRLVLAVIVWIGLALPASGQTNRYNLNSQELAVVTTWLFEPFGYLDAAKNIDCISARQALQANPTLNVTQWIRDNTMGCGTGASDWNETAMIWWIRANSGVTINAQNRPPEAAAWETILIGWDLTIDDAFARADALQRNANGCAITTYGSDGLSSGSIPCGNQLTAQSSMIEKVIAVL